MPLLAFLLATGFALPTEAALGLIIMGTCPGGTQQHVLVLRARRRGPERLHDRRLQAGSGRRLMPLCLFIYARPFTDQTVSIPTETW